MTGSGTALDPYIIYDVDDLQDIGKGDYSAKSYSRPWDDSFGEAGQSGTWTIYPDDGLYWSKVDEETSDDDSTYIQAASDGAYCLLAFIDGLSLPENATSISVAIKAMCRNTASGTSYIQGMVKEGGTSTEYMIGSNTAVSSQTYSTKTWTMSNPPWRSEDDWTPTDVYALSTSGVGVKVSDASPNIRITQMWIEITYDDITYSLDAYYELANDIDASGFGFVPIVGFFTGILNGKNYKVSNLTITISDSFYQYGALFYSISTGIVQNLELENCSISVTSSDRNAHVAGIAISNYGTILNCRVSGTITARGQGAIETSRAGGIATYNYNTINKCQSTALITINSNRDAVAGGLTQWNGGDGIINESYAFGNVNITSLGTGRRFRAGGLIYYNDGGHIDNCYARGNASAVGGTEYNYAAGFIINNLGVVTNSYSTGAPTGASGIGGFCQTNGGTITDCFWDTQTSGIAVSDGGTGKTTAEMKEMLTFLAWDIGATATDRNEGYPFLSWEIDESATIWLVYGTGISPPYTTPDIYDWKGRVAKGARIQAYRTDTHALVATETINQYGNATFTELPNDVDIRFIVNWGGTAQNHKSRTFTRRVEQVTDGGTGYSTAENARSNLGIGATISIWNLILGD